MKKITLMLFVLALVPSVLYAKNDDDLKNIEEYLNNIKTLEADFIQTASNGNNSNGKIYIQKPNKVNMQYDEATNISIIGDGKYVVYHDKDLDQVTHISYKDIPATLILGNDIKIDGKNIKATNFYKDVSTTSVVLEYVDNDNVGPITLIFNNNPFELKQWKIVDPQGVEIVLSLYNVNRDIKLDDKLFKFKDKRFNPLGD